MRKIANWTCAVLLLMASACSGGGEPTPEPLSLIGSSMNGGPINDGATNVPIDVQLEFTFSAALNIAQFEAAFSVIAATDNPTYRINYANASSKAVISLSGLNSSTLYNLQIVQGQLGANGQSLENSINISFTTVSDGIVRQMAPCTSVSQDCYRTVSLHDAAQNSGNFNFYSTYPIYLENAEWENLKYAVIVIHGANRDANNYFNFLLNPLNSNGLLDNTILISPEFESNSAASNNDLSWNNDWREGQKSNSNAKITSFEAIDALITRLSDKTAFPALEKVIITGHSSGALFTQVYGVANVVAPTFDHLSFDYVVANSQYFYYPDNQRYNEGNNQFYTPTGCNTYNHWPLGYVNAPAYVTTRTESEIDANLLTRKFTYFLGNGTGNDSALNTSDCDAILLGSSRFKRGEHIYNWIQTQYAGQNNSSKVVVNGIGHDGQGMYQSTDFKNLISNIFN
ncbi:MAG: hypothetical protein ACI905_002128 [Roseivirga sp.]|jgi:hypothetical protein